MNRNDHSIPKQVALALTALGVVYGDIGTSPLYALKEAFHPGHHMMAQPETIIGLLSLIFWSLMIVISLKYLVFILRADNKGEGGILALTALAVPLQAKKSLLTGRLSAIILLGVFGTALLYGDGIITPAISILSAVEGLSLITPVFEPYIIPITIGILIGLFSIQKHGTSIVGRIFGPITLLWFLVLGTLGIYNIIQAPEVFAAIDPRNIFYFFKTNSWHGFAVLGSVFLVVTGGEALYSDLGHFGKRSIRQAWFTLVLPCLVLNYFGQGALLIRNPAAIANPFYLMAPSWSLIPLVLLASVATTIASQALITGVFSLTMQAVQNGFAPRFLISHTSKDAIGQIYIRGMNRLMMIGCIALVVLFKSSSNLAAAYGLAVTTTMVITTVLFYFVAREKWHWSLPKALSICGIFLVIDLGFLGANLIKIPDGGWVPLVIGIAGFTFMTTWKAGRQLLTVRLQERMRPLTEYLLELKQSSVLRIPGTAIYLNRILVKTPYALIHTREHFKAVHRHLVFLSVQTENVPKVNFSERVTTQRLLDDSYQIILRYGYLEKPDIPRDIEGLTLGDFVLSLKESTFVIGRESLFATDRPGMALWREKLFSMTAKNELSATEYFQLPKDRVIEIGMQIAL